MYKNPLSHSIMYSYNNKLSHIYTLARDQPIAALDEKFLLTFVSCL